MFSSIENNFTGFNFLQSVQNVLIILKSHDCIFIKLFHECDVSRMFMKCICEYEATLFFNKNTLYKNIETRTG